MSTTRPPAYDQASGSVEASRRGAHRARAKPALAGLPILAGILIVVAAVGGAWYVLNDTTKDSASQVGAQVVDGEVTSTATVPASAGAVAASDEPSVQPSQSATIPPTADNAVAPDRSLSVRVLNSVPVQGLAARVADDLTPNGWTVSGTANSIQKNLAVTKIYYGSKAAKNGAQTLRKDLGFGTVVADASVAKKGLVVVLGQDAQ